ncbi:MAG: DUF4136 domain-containing protein [Thermodesulfobacteriota bacterium]|nr:DUF4136 domain-containing protein [Thermodesulfobacteriota bacterium]
MIKYKYFLWAIASFFFCSCAARVTNLSPVFHKDKPHIQTFKSITLDNNQYKTFSVYPVSHLKKEPLLKNDIIEMQILFFLRNILEIRGYKYVKKSEKPDILVTVDGIIQSKKNSVPPASLTSPKWIFNNITPQDKSSKPYHLDTRIRHEANGYGAFTGKTTPRVYIPGNITKQAYTSPLHRTGTFYPIIRIDIFSPHSDKPIWVGIGIGTANNSDLRISGQTIAIFLLGEFPKGPLSYDHIMSAFGFGFFVFTNNGNDYYPTVFKVIKNSPADEAGIRMYDMISSIDGVTSKNKPVSEILKMFKKEGEKKLVTVFRLERQIDIEIFPRSSRSY